MLQEIQILLKEISDLLQDDKKSSKKKAAAKLRSIKNIAETYALTLEVSK